MVNAIIKQLLLPPRELLLRWMTSVNTVFLLLPLREFPIPLTTNSIMDSIAPFTPSREFRRVHTADS